MGYRTLLILNAIITGLFGLGLIFAPEQMAAMNGFESSLALVAANRQHGAANIGLAVLSWLVRDLSNGPARTGILASFLVGYGLSLLVSLFAQFGETANAAGWGGILVTFVLTAWFGWETFRSYRMEK